MEFCPQSRALKQSNWLLWTNLNITSVRNKLRSCACPWWKLRRGDFGTATEVNIRSVAAVGLSKNNNQI